jgi:hypothetical protein
MALIARKHWIIITGIMGIAALAGFWVVVQTADFSEPMPIQEPKAQPSPEHLARIKVENEFEVILKDFLKQISARMKIYSDKRKVLVEIIKPENNRSRDMTQENLNYAKNIIVEMAQDTDDFMKIFNQAEEKFITLSNQQNRKFKDTVLPKWKALKDTQTKKYLSYFLMDKDIADLHIALLNFYRDHHGQFTINETDFQLVFPNAELKKRYDTILSDIEAVRLQQISLTAKQSPDPMPEAAP